ncbi:MAG: hypothetical protein BECKG1743F_GA0114225_101116 [Candidatus Kentron sp. G]|nr:MAG: hypothetical protein BECKG1743F_GA0114225_101116 [Candidatus Kentron sp. G]VFM97524.1 MAG: hypothetical protein BECKG1743E_GA0114224_101362 [Candidatus Kentron sp. G]
MFFDRNHLSTLRKWYSIRFSIRAIALRGRKLFLRETLDARLPERLSYQSRIARGRAKRWILLGMLSR